MVSILGIDTSNYTTSCALYDCESGRVHQAKQLLPVKGGEAGLRQSDAVFHHIKQLPQLLERLFSEYGETALAAVAVSTRPRSENGSYMPCFLAGEATARGIAASTGAKLFTTSHQTGHVLAALYSADKLCWLKEEKPFIAFHVSGGTTDVLLCRPNSESVLDITRIASSLDLKAGQAVDRVGLSLGLSFPCGKELEKLAANADKHYKCKAVIKDGNCCLSGLENKCAELLSKGESRENVAAYCLDYIGQTIIDMTGYALSEYGQLSIIYAGGVMSDKLLQSRISDRFDACFADAEFSCDNAAGVAIYGMSKYCDNDRAIKD